MKKVVLAKYGEIALRGKNRAQYENRLIVTLKKNLEGLETHWVRREQGRLLIERPDGDVDFDVVLPRIKAVLGIVGFCPCVQTSNQDIANLQQTALAYMEKFYPSEPFTFKVETRRAVKKYPLTSGEVSALVGGYIFHAMPHATVDVKNPQVVVHVELRNDAYIYTDAVAGFGGLPVGSSGKGMLLLSGGIDSPVAGFLMAKRGVELEAVYFHAPPFTSPRAEQKVHDLAKQLTLFTGKTMLHVVNFTPIQTYLHDHVPQEKLTLFLKRAMMAVATQLAQKAHCQCLIMGDSVGQVASQTLHGLCAVNSATTLPVLRPLAGHDKQEIMDIAKKIDTYDISIRPFEDCCTLFVAKHPETRPKTSVIEAMEAQLHQLPQLVVEAVDQSVRHEF